jgi:hypothetical protein
VTRRQKKTDRGTGRNGDAENREIEGRRQKAAKKK